MEIADEPVRLEQIREATMNDEEFMGELIDIFLIDTPKQLDSLRRALDGGEGEYVAAAAHRLKGASGNLGAQSLSALCRKLEESARESRLDEIPSLLTKVDEEYSRVKNFLTKIRQGKI